MDRAMRFISRVLLSKPSNARFLLELRDGPKLGEQLRKFKPQDLEHMEFLAIVKREKHENGTAFSLSDKGLNLINCLYELISAAERCLPGFDDE